MRSFSTEQIALLNDRQTRPDIVACRIFDRMSGYGVSVNNLPLLSEQVLDAYRNHRYVGYNGENHVRAAMQAVAIVYALASETLIESGEIDTAANLARSLEQSPAYKIIGYYMPEMARRGHPEFSSAEGIEKLTKQAMLKSYQANVARMKALVDDFFSNPNGKSFHHLVVAWEYDPERVKEILSGKTRLMVVRFPPNQTYAEDIELIDFEPVKSVTFERILQRELSVAVFNDTPRDPAPAMTVKCLFPVDSNPPLDEGRWEVDVELVDISREQATFLCAIP